MKTLTELLNTAYQSEEPTTAFAGTIDRMAIERDRKVARKQLIKRRIRLSLGGLSLAGALTIGLILEPRIALSMMLNKVTGAMAKQGLVHFKVYTLLPDGSRKLAREFWHQGDQDRMDIGRNITWTRGSIKWDFDANSKVVFVTKDSGGMFGKKPTGFTGSAMLKEIEGSSWLDKVSTETDGDQVVTSVVGKNERTRVRLWINKSTDLPTKYEIQAPRGSAWETEQIGEFDFSNANADVLTPKIPSDVQQIDRKDAVNQLKLKWREPLFTYKEKDKVQIYDVQVNEEGDVFVLYTARWAWNRIHLEDSLGTTYLHGESDFQPTMGYLNSDKVDGFSVAGNRLEGILFYPVEKGPWRPKTLRLVVQPEESTTIPASAGHKFLKNGKEYYSWSPAEVAAYQAKFSGNFGHMKERTYSLQIDKPTCQSLPTYMAFMPIGINDEHDLTSKESRARADFFLATKDYAQAEAAARLQIKSFDRMCLEIGSPGVQPDAYFNLYEALAGQGKHEEAVATLKLIPDQMIYKNDELKDKVEAAFKKEGL